MSPPLFAAIRLEGIQPGHAWLWAVLGLAAIAFLAWTYLGIFQRSERRLTWLLFGLRAVGLSLLVLILAQPTWTREREEVDPGRVVVIVDTSRSMSLPDASGATRYARARDTVMQLRQALQSSPGRARLAVDLFDIKGTQLTGDLPEQPSADSTDLARALSEARRQTRSRPVVGMVLVSDGMDTTTTAGFHDWKDTALPIHGIGFRAAEAVDLDLAVRKPQTPARVLVHNEVSIDVPLVKTGRPATEATVSLKRGREVLASEKVKLGEGSREQMVPLRYTPSQPGSFVLTAVVEGATGERNMGNNARHFPLRVDAEPIRVLYLEGFLRYEYKYLHARLEDDPDVALASLVRRISPDAPGGRGERGELTAKQLEQCDVLILGDMEAGFLSAAEYRRILQWLDGKNHSLLVLGGYRSFGPDGLAKTPLADALPVVFASAPPYQSEDRFSLQLSERGRNHPIFTLASDRVRSEAMWKEAPPLQGMSLVQRVKPGAEVLVDNPTVERDGKPAPVLVVQRAAGGGQVMVLAVDTTWLWSRLPRLLGQNDTLYGRFWSQTVRWLAGRGMDEQRPLLSVSTDRPDYEAGKKVTVRATRQPQPNVDLSAAEASVELTTPSGQALVVPVRADPANPDVFVGEYYPSAGGRYEVTARLTAAGKPLANQTAEFLVQGQDLEMASTATNPGNLQALATATGGVYVDIDQADELAARIPHRERRTVRPLRSEYWNSPWLFVAFLLAVTGEWLLRRRNHLV
jgi:hypothetical protein